MSATATLRPIEITDRALENKYFQRRALENRYLEAKYFQKRLSSKFFELADRLWLADIEDAAALIELEDRLSRAI